MILEPGVNASTPRLTILKVNNSDYKDNRLNLERARLAVSMHNSKIQLVSRERTFPT